MTTAFAKLLAALTSEGVRFVVIGGVALVARGGARLTHALDLVYDRAPRNLLRLVKAVAPLRPRLRGAHASAARPPSSRSSSTNARCAPA